MTVTILEALQNADYNLGQWRKVGEFVIEMANAQLHNATVLLDKGYGISDEVEPLLEAHGVVEDVPDKEDRDG